MDGRPCEYSSNRPFLIIYSQILCMLFKEPRCIFLLNDDDADDADDDDDVDDDVSDDEDVCDNEVDCH